MSAPGARAILIAYEDQYFEQFHLLVKALRRDRGLPGLCLEGRTVHGTGGFAKEIPRYLRMPLKQTKQPPDLVVCLGDADRATNLTPDASPAPAQDDAVALERWVREIEHKWHTHLVRKGPLDEQAATRLRTVCLRWNKESLFLANPDALLEHAEQHERRPQIETLLDTCKPRPSALDDAKFLLAYRKPGHCMDLVFRAIEGRSYKKGRDDEDLLRLHIKPHETRRALTLRRCPDLERLLHALQ
ncbi:MAG TPA: hypothetical protein VIK91_22170 [Nannocystis sp.]